MCGLSVRATTKNDSLKHRQRRSGLFSAEKSLYIDVSHVTHELHQCRLRLQEQCTRKYCLQDDMTTHPPGSKREEDRLVPPAAVKIQRKRLADGHPPTTARFFLALRLSTRMPAIPLARSRTFVQERPDQAVYVEHAFLALRSVFARLLTFAVYGVLAKC